MKESEFSEESGHRTRSTERGDKAEPVASPSPDESSGEQYLDYREEWQAAASDSVGPAVEGRSRENIPPGAGADGGQGNQATSGPPASQEGVYAPIDGQ